ncbi:GGDEF domain-containing protein [Marinomonas sp. M1K-6]|uniref:diguanylate cyclase n=1 Tax=Marinomonas profundi TaxID=2726122 RepID=A0A847R2W4_9GAMM|nr:sensor domain-containing diguanylate cyclase [Marinomonas profundi]NLQ16236.1 GGDEF domain-containing protein [Marinomonas profundi]UDV03187.1 GGDEF domain-containing protein [Marinomonas profundi]
MFRLNLQKLFLLLTVLAVLFTFANSYYTTYQVQKQRLIDSTLEANRVYAAKLAETTNNSLESSQKQLAYSAAVLAKDFTNEALLNEEVKRLFQQSNYFNSVSIVNSKAIVAAIFPLTIPVKGNTLSDGARQSFNTRKPLVTDPFIAPTGRYLASVSHPIYHENGDYLGYIAGTIYLNQDNMFFKLLGQHPYNDGSYLYVVSRQREIIYHHDQHRIGQHIENNPVLNAAVDGQWGSSIVVNSLGIPMIAGYAHIERAGWGIVAQRPFENSMAELDIQLMEVVLRSLPILLLTLLLIWLASRYITKPLQALADHAKDMDKSDAEHNINQIKAWYFEAFELKQATLRGLSTLNSKIYQLNEDSYTDPLTQLYNRRGLESVLSQWEEQKLSFAIIALDIDHFKLVNDTFGHDVGDEVLQNLSAIIRRSSNTKAILCRNGGEEFLILLPATSPHLAYRHAEKVRIEIAAFNMPTAGKITVSLGISFWDADSDNSIKTALKTADTALYQAKRQGRNCSVIAE